ncbi:MAG: hypothetical protein HRU13_08355 [Phycisphaerales bacterium]|nr:hypothetical protein [Phycisphaerales bacterium]
MSDGTCETCRFCDPLGAYDGQCTIRHMWVSYAYGCHRYEAEDDGDALTVEIVEAIVDWWDALE